MKRKEIYELMSKAIDGDDLLIITQAILQTIQIKRKK
jgi:hypothetical protein